MKTTFITLRLLITMLVATDAFGRIAALSQATTRISAEDLSTDSVGCLIRRRGERLGGLDRERALLRLMVERSGPRANLAKAVHFHLPSPFCRESTGPLKSPHPRPIQRFAHATLLAANGN